MAQSIKLSFELGWSKTNRIWTLSKNSNFLAQDGVLYPFPFYTRNTEYTALGTADNFIYSDKVYNVSMEDVGGGVYYEAIFLTGKAIPLAPPINLQIETLVGRKGEMELNNTAYSTFFFDYEPVLEDLPATPLGLTSFSLAWNSDSHTMFAAYVNTIFSLDTGYNVLTTTLLTNDTISIKELAARDDPVVQLFIITEQQFFRIDPITGDETLIPNELYNLTSIAPTISGVNKIWISGIRDGVDTLGIYDIGSDTFFYRQNPRTQAQTDGKNIAINRLYSRYQVDDIIMCTDDGVLFMNPATAEITGSTLIGRAVFDVGSAGAGQFWRELYATDDGIFWFNTNSNGSFSSGKYSRIAIFAQAVDVVRGAALRPTSAAHEVIAFYGDAGGNFTEENYLDPQFFTDIKPFGVDGETDSALQWLASSIGTGIWSAPFINPLIDPQTTSLLTFIHYTSSLIDVVKHNENTCLYLMRLEGSSGNDSNSVLVEYNFMKDELFTGEIGSFVPMDRLWAVGDVYLMRNSETRSIFYYRLNTSLNIQTVSTSNDFGQFQTTFAGDIVDILPHEDIFYILGTRGIEVWQNIGAAGFPFRKQPYLSAPYQTSPASNKNTYRFPVKYWDYYQGGFIAITYSNQSNQLALLKLSGGHVQALPVDWRLFYSILSFLSAGTEILDYGLGVQNMWGKNYIGISLIVDLVTGRAINTIFLDDKLNFFMIDDLLSTNQTFSVMSTSTNGLNVIYDSAASELVVDTALSFPPTVPTGNTYFVDSQLIEMPSTIVSLEKLLIEIAFPIEDGTNYPPAATYQILISADEGRTFNIVRTATLNPLVETLVEKNLGSYPSAIVRIQVDTPIIILNSTLSISTRGAS